MAAIDFPASPTVGQIFDPGGGLSRYVWTGAVWNAVGTSIPKAWMSLSTAPPSNPVDGDFWWQTDTGLMFLRYNDGNSTQWVIVNPAQDLAGLDSRYAQGGGNAGCFKISSGGPTGAAQASQDIFFPAASSWPGGFELILGGVLPVNATDTFIMRTSNDGSTFNATASYRYAHMVYQDSGGAPPAGLASTGTTQIALNGTHANSAGYKSGYRLFFPPTENGQSHNVLVHGWYFNGTNMVMVTGLGVSTTTGGNGMPLGVRLMFLAGNMAAGFRWQLNGFK